MLLNTSTRAYNLRTRTGTGIATQSERALNESPSLIDADNHSNEVAPQNEDFVPIAEDTNAVRLYSEVVASRSPSPRRERLAQPQESTAKNAGAKLPARLDEEKSSHGDDSEREGNSLNREVETPDRVEYSNWTTVKRRRARSEGSLRNKYPLPNEEMRTVKKAPEGLTTGKRQTAPRHQEKARPRRDTSVSSRGEGPSRPKGKGTDPREWGNVDFSREDIDVEAQAAALRSFKKSAKAAGKRPKEKSHRRDGKPRSSNQDRERRGRHDVSSSKKHKKSHRPLETQPAAQIAPRSYLGTALKAVRHSRGSRLPSEPSSSSSSSSSDSSSDSSYDSSSESSSTHSGDDSTSDGESTSSYESERSHRRGKRRRNNHGRNKPRRRHSRSSTRRSSIKPIPPKEYDGAADVRAYHRFVRESDAYLRDGKVRGPRKVFLLSYYLTGKAYDFYTQKVSINEEQWTVPQFYEELFNFCFPVDYRMQLRKTLARCHQNDKSVAEYTHELQDLFNMIGNIPKQDQVLKFWNSARASIQKELWRNKLNPELSSWNTVVAQAEIIEIAENVAERRDRRPGQSVQASGGGGGHSKSKNPSTDGSVRAVAFGPSSRRGNHGKRHGGPRSNSHVRDNHARGSTPRSREETPSNHPSNKGKSRGDSTPPKNHNNNRHQPRKTPQLSDKEKAEYRAAGRCFNCGKEGHMSRNCPDNETIKSQGRGPPGAASFNVELMSLLEVGDDDDTEVLESLPLGAMFFGDPEKLAPLHPPPLNEWRLHYPYWDEPNMLARRRIGDCYAMMVDSILTLASPYPGDDVYDVPELRPELRFSVKWKARTRGYEVTDRLTETEAMIPRHLLEDPDFNLSRWYAEQRAQALGLTERINHHWCIGDPISIVATKLLTDGIASSYPCTDPRLDPCKRFYLWRTPLEDGQIIYRVVDVDLDIRVDMQLSWLEDPEFDLVSWYRRYITQQGFFEYKYYDTHQESYRKDSLREASGSSGGREVAEDPSPNTGSEAEWDNLPELESLSLDDYFEENIKDEVELDDVPNLEAMSDSDESDNEEEDSSTSWLFEDRKDDDTIIERVATVLTLCQPYPGDTGREPVDRSYAPGDQRVIVERQDRGLFCVYDRVQGYETYIHVSKLRWDAFSIGKWFAERCAVHSELDDPWGRAHRWMLSHKWEETIMGPNPVRGPSDWVKDQMSEPPEEAMDLGGIQVDRNKYPALQRNAAQIKGNQRVLPKPIVIKVTVDGHPARALLDTGSLGDFMSSTLADQLGVKKEVLDAPLALQLAVQGSRSKVNSVTTVKLQYQDINESRTFDIINLNSYDLILGTPWMHQHQVCVGFNPARIVIGSDEAQPLKAGNDTKLMVHALTPDGQAVEDAREELRQYAAPLCKGIAETNLPPLRDINHTIPLIDEEKTYPWRPSRCPEIFREQWVEKRDAYIKSGRWNITSARNTVPMLLIPKPNTNPPQLRTVVDLRERNRNTRKLTSPLPDMEGMLRRTASKPFRTALDLKNAYEQIRIIPEHVPRSAVTTPDGNMVSQVVQQGDCNAPATYQALMNHLFSAYVGRFLDIYLDDIVIYSDSLEEHKKHVKMVIDILEKEKLYLSGGKLRFIAPELKLLGRVVDDEGIRMDAEKVDSVLKWKVPTNRDLLRGFIGAVGYLADDVPNVRIPMGVLSAITGDTVPFRWGYTEQRAFDEVKTLVQRVRENRRVPLDYSDGAPPIWMITDGCATGISGIVSQGNDWKTARIAAFYSAKLNSAQQNYPVHEIELFAGIETMLRHIDILQGAKFKWLTDHKGLIYLLNQKNLSGRQARWLEKISTFTFEVDYIAGSENVVADALSRIYSNDSPGTVRARSEYTYHDVVDDDTVHEDDHIPVLAGIEARIATRRSTRDRRPSERALLASESSVPSARMSRSVRQKLQPLDESTEGGSTVEKSPTVVHNEDTPPTVVHEEENLPAEAQEGGPGEQNTLLNIVSQSLDGLDLLAELRGKYETDPTFQPIIARPKDFRNFEVDGQLIYLKKQGGRVLCIPKALIQGRSAQEIVISEAHSLLAHLGANKTLDYLQDHCWWKNMVSDVRAFCETCHTCKTSKPSNQKPYGLLNPLSVPSYPWESVGMDFVGPLPESGNRDGLFDSITVVICLLTSMVHLIPSRTNYSASQLAELIFEHIYKLHGLPRNIISDRDVLFTSTFWKQLHRLIGTRLRLSSAYHPQSDGSTERANRTITQMLRQCVNPNQKDWVARLPAIEFAINSARSESTGFAPFFLNSGRMPRTILWDAKLTDEFPSVRKFALEKKLAIMAAHDSILSARIKQTRDANRRRRVAPFKEGELVYLASKNISFAKGLARKLIPKYIGPYKILQDFHNSSFKLDLPSHLKRRGVHDVFHSSLLREHIPNDDRLFPGQLDTQIGDTPDTEGEWAVDRILSHAGSKANTVFEIQWKSGDITWLPYYQITHLRALAEYLDLLGEKNIHKLPKGTGRPPLEDPQLFLGSADLESPASLSPSNPVPRLDKSIHEVSSHPHNCLDSFSTQHPSTFLGHNPSSSSCLHLSSGDQAHEGSITPTSLVYPPPSTVFATSTTRSASPSTLLKSLSSCDSTRKFANTTSPPSSIHIPSDTLSSAMSGMKELPPTIPEDSVSSDWQMIPRTTPLSPQKPPYTSLTSTLPQLRLALPPTTNIDPQPLPRTTSLTSMRTSWLRNKGSNGSLLKNDDNEGLGPSTTDSSLTQASAVLLTSPHPFPTTTSVPGTVGIATKRVD